MSRPPTYIAVPHGQHPLDVWMVYDPKTSRVVASDLSQRQAVTLAMTLNLVG